MRVVAIVQARMSSTRFPGKVLADVAGRPMLHRVVSRVSDARLVDDLVVATSTNSADDAVAELCAHLGVTCFRGSESDVLDRYRNAAAASSADAVARLTADCPLLDPEVIDRVIGTYSEGGWDYVSNIDPPTYPDGLDTEVFAREALERAWREARLASEREHVTPYIRGHPMLFRARNVTAPSDLSALRWTVDEPRDIELVRAVYRALGERAFGMSDVLDLLRERSDLALINTGIARNEGYLRSLREDHEIVPEARSGQ